MRVGVIGAGLQGRRRAKAVIDTGEAKITVVADIDRRAAADLAAVTGAVFTTAWEEVVAADVDAILVCTPPHLHAPVTVAAAGAGKHVLCEKPLARNFCEGRRMVEAARTGGIVLKCGFNLRHHPGVEQARAWIDEGEIGEAVFLRLRYGIGGRPGYEREWRVRAAIAGGGQLMDQGMHALDLCRYFLGEFATVKGVTATGFWPVSPLEDNAFGLLKTEKGQVASLHVSWTQWKNLFSLEVYGKEGYVTVEGLGGSYGGERAILGRRDFSRPFSETVIEFRGEDRSWQAEWQEFCAAVKEGREPSGSGRDGLEALKLALMLYDSAGRGD
ncbi:MAG: gfo/Idh/MocA family oxidoreductase [Peptococcaceae bacterium]|nr:MAG: gfo/Idh/MocA family oxidoreductase [Peptococcaceae bacterium]